MTAVDLRDEIEEAMGVMWPGFVEERPGLAMLMDLRLVLDAAAEHFADDGEYQHALADAAARGASEAEMKRLVRRLVRTWLRSLV
jgi:hypothetical protein